MYSSKQRFETNHSKKAKRRSLCAGKINSKAQMSYQEATVHQLF